MTIPFTQYLRPNGIAVDVTIDMDDETELKAHRLLEVSTIHFDIEELSTGVVSMTCEDREDVISIELCENNEEVIAAVERLVASAYERVFGNIYEDEGR